MNFSLQKLKHDWVTTRGVAPEDFLVLSLFVLQMDRAELFRQADHILTPQQGQALVLLLKRRLLHEPVAYLTGEKEFFGRTFFVSNATLIPRPESECLLEDVLTFRVNDRAPDFVIDVGTGCGALIVSLASEFAKAATKFIGSDISENALRVAQKNSALHKTDIQFLQGSLLEPFHKVLQSTQKQFVFIIANLPYVSRELLKKSPADVRNFEPITALVSENVGMAHYQKLFCEIKKCDFIHGWCWIEISPEQKEVLVHSISALFSNTDIFIGKDLSQKDRFIRFLF